MELERLETFIAVAEEQGFSRASDRLYVVWTSPSSHCRPAPKPASN